MKAGIAFAYGQDKSTLDESLGSLTLDNYQLAAYARWENLGNSGVCLDASAGIGEHKTRTQREITFLNQVASASYSARSASVSAEVGRDFEQDKVTHKVVLTPYLGLSLSQIKRDGFTETGSDADLTVQGQTSRSQRSALGLRTAWQTQSWAPTLNVAWAHDSGDTRGTLDAAFAALPGQTAFTMARNSAATGCSSSSARPPGTRQGRAAGRGLQRRIRPHGSQSHGGAYLPQGVVNLSGRFDVNSPGKGRSRSFWAVALVGYRVAAIFFVALGSTAYSMVAPSSMGR